MTNNLLSEILSSQSAKLTVKQGRIIEAAIRLFAEKGYSNTSTSEIAKVAYVSEGSIFKQYGTKDKLLLSLIVPHLKEIIPSKVDEIISLTSNENSTFEGFLTDFLKNRVVFIMENREISQIFIKELIYKEELKRDLIPYISEVAAPRLSKIIEVFKESGEVIDLPTDRILALLLTFIGGFLASHFVLLNKELITDEEIDNAIRFVMKGIRKSSSDK